MKPKTRFNKLTAWLLTLAMIFTMLPSFTFTALAADHTNHCVCGKASTETVEGHTHSESVPQWTEWTGTDTLPTTGGYYYLTADVQLSAPWTPASGTVLCLNGHTITAPNGSYAVLVDTGLTFTLTDCSRDQKEGYLDGNYLWHAGTAPQNEQNAREYNLTGGVITGAGDTDSSTHYGAIYVAGTFKMYGGNIAGNDEHGGVMAVTGSNVTMYGGKICGNSTTANGGGVHLYDSDSEVRKPPNFTMHGGEIADNSALGGSANCGGVYVGQNAKFTMSGQAKVVGNDTDKEGSGIYVDIGGNAVLSGEASVTGNKNAAGDDGAIYCAKSGTVTLTDSVSVTNNEGNGIYGQSGSTIALEAGNTGTIQVTDNAGIGISVIGTLTLNGRADDPDSILISDNAGTGIEVGDGGILAMSNSTISGNQGGGIYVSRGGEFSISDSIISENKAIAGAGILIEGVGSVTNTTITDNVTQFQGGGMAIQNNGEVCISGGEITGNRAGRWGGGIYLDNNGLQLAGEVKITGNAADDGAKNLYFWSDDYTVQIDVDGENLTYGAQIGVSHGETPAEGAPLTLTTPNGADYSEYFFSDNALYGTYSGANGAVMLGVNKTITYLANGGSGEQAEDAYPINGTFTLPDSTTFTPPEGKKLKGWSLSENGEIVDTHVITGDTTFYAIWYDYKVEITGVITQNGTYNGQPHIGYAGTITSGAYIGEYTVSYTGTTAAGVAYTGTTPPTEAGNYTVTIRVPDEKPVGVLDYEGSIGLNFSIDKADPTVNTPTAVADLTYTGEPQNLVTAGSSGDGEMWYAVGTDSTTTPTDSWSTDIPEATHAVTYYVWYKVVGDTNHNDTTPQCLTVTIAKAALTVTANDCTITYGEASSNNGVTYAGFVNGENKNVLSGELTYSYSYVQNGNVGDYTITPAGLTSENYDITFVDGTLTVDAKDASMATVTLEQESYQYDGTAKEPAVLSVVVDGKTLIKDKDYTVEYDYNINADVGATVRIHFQGNYISVAHAGFEITPREVTAPAFVGVEESYLHTGSAIAPTFTLMDGETEIPANEYTVEYSNNTDVGTATITITDNEGGNYNVSGTAKFTIAKHTHDWDISANGNVITATCQSTFGDCPNPTSTVTLVAPENLVYDGNDKVVTTNGTIEGVTIPDVQYTGDRKNVGTFTASLTVDNVMATLSVTIEKAEVNNVSFDVTAPEALDEKQTTVANGTGYTAAISWNTEAEKFGFNTAYTATVTLAADGNYKFADTLSKDGWTVELNNDKTVATFTKTFEETRKQKIESVTAPTNVNLDNHKSDADAVIATLPTNVSVALEENGMDNLTIEWSCANFNTAPLYENTFTWNATNDKYDSNNVALTGTITVTNPAANAVTITVKTENTTVVYNAADVDLTSLFDIDTNAGTATYTVTNGTGAGTQDGTALTVTKAGTFTVKVDTAANGIYAAGSQTATLTVNKADGTGTVSMEGWTYGETAKEPHISSNKGTATYQYKVKGADDSTYSPDKPSNAGEYTVKATFAETELYNGASATADFTIARKDIAGATVGAFAVLTYTGVAQTPDATVTVDGLTVTGNWSNVTNVADTTTFTASGNFVGTIADKETGMARANSSVTSTPNANTLTYNEAAQELVTAGAANGGTIKYSLDNETWSEAIPTGTNADAYEVWYKVFGDANHNDTEAVKVDVTIAMKSIEDATVALDGALTYNGAEQTQNVTVTLDGFTVTFDVTDNKATDVKAEGNYILKVTANGNFEGEKTLEWNIAKADHIIEGENVPTASSIRRGNKLSTSTIAPAELKDSDGNVLGTFTWVTPDDEMTETGDFVKQVKFTPTDTNNYNEKTFDVTVSVTRPSSSGGGYSNTTTTTTKNEDGSTTKTTTNKSTGTVTEVTTNPDGSTSTVETKKDGTVTTTEKDKEGNTTTTVEKPDGTSTTTEKNKDGSEKVTEEKADGTTVTTEKDTDGTKTVTTENADGSTTTEETKKDGTKVTTETNADGETTAEVEAKGETEVVIPVDNAEDVTKVVVTDKDGNETEVEFEVKDGGVAISVSGNSTVSVQTGHTCYAKDFTDVDLDTWYHLNIDYVLENGLMKGTAADKFAPNANLTRAMLVTVLYRLEGEPSVSGITSFADLEQGQYYLDAICWAQINGIVNGVSETEFAPNDNITREQIAAIMHRYAQYKGYDVSVGENTNILSYDDFDNISEYAIASMQYAVGSGLMKGKTTSTLNPLDNATRAEIAAILHRFIEANK